MGEENPLPGQRNQENEWQLDDLPHPSAILQSRSELGPESATIAALAKAGCVLLTIRSSRIPTAPAVSTTNSVST